MIDLQLESNSEKSEIRVCWEIREVLESALEDGVGAAIDYGEAAGVHKGGVVHEETKSRYDGLQVDVCLLAQSNSHYDYLKNS